ncbi:MAG TPA: hypothetical protein VL972_07270 [Solirubrobacteraceae bacterium]|nr:hypothetical protein [Solirubrobacteraceae bacterium]
MSISANRLTIRSTAILIALLAGLALAACGSSSKTKTSSTAATTTPATGATSAAGTSPGHESAPGVVSASAGPVSATMHASTHHPTVGKPWPLTFTVTSAGAPAKASIGYEYLFGGQVVAHRSHYLFTGHFADVFHWPAEAVGYPLTFRAVIVSGGHTIDLDYPVQVVK